MNKIPFYDFVVESLSTIQSIAKKYAVDYDFDYIIDNQKDCCEVVFYVLRSENNICDNVKS